MAVLGLVQLNASGEPTVTTETAVTAFGLLAGVGGGIQQLLASRKLGSLRSGRIGLSQLLVPVGVSFLGSVLGAFFLPGEL